MKAPVRPAAERWRARRRRLSVVVPVYNLETMLARSLDSILAQPVRDLEVVIVDDGSTDGSTAIAQAYARPGREGAGSSSRRTAGCPGPATWPWSTAPATW